MSDEYRLTHCDFCEQRTQCSNIFVALRILESEMRYCRDPGLLNRFEQISKEISDLGYYFPRGIDHCKLADNPLRAEELIQRLEHLLKDVRRQVKIV